MIFTPSLVVLSQDVGNCGDFDLQQRQHLRPLQKIYD